MNTYLMPASTVSTVGAPVAAREQDSNTSLLWADAFTGLYDGNGQDVAGCKPPLIFGKENFARHILARPHIRALGHYRRQPMDVRLLWFMPRDAPIPASTLSAMVFAIDTGGVVVLHAADLVSLNAACAMVMQMVGGVWV